MPTASIVRITGFGSAGIIGVLLLLTGYQAACIDRPLPAPGPLGEPRQRELATPRELPAPKGFTITATHEYDVTAVVVSRKRYRLDHEASVCPVDVILAWGPLTEEPNNEAIKWRQGGRWGYWRPLEEATVSTSSIARYAANTHLVPPEDDPATRSAVMALRRGDVVRLSGYLVNIMGDDGWRWSSSRTRTDTGDGSCELFYVTGFENL